MDGKSRITLELVKIVVATVVAFVAVERWVDYRIDQAQGKTQEYFGQRIATEEKRHQEVMEQFKEIRQWQKDHTDLHLRSGNRR